LDRRTLPEGSVLLVGTVSYLHRVGVGQYCREWTQVIDRVGRRWPNVRVGPLVPVIREDAPGGVSRELVEYASWLSKVYAKGIQGLGDCWNHLVTRVINNSVGLTPLGSADRYTISLPSDLTPLSPTIPSTFESACSRPSILKGMDKGQYHELLGTICSVLSRDFHVEAGVGAISANAMQDTGAKEVSKLVLAGASNLRKVAPHLTGMGFEVLDLCTPGWLATPENVAVLEDKIRSLDLGNDVAIVFDLYGNSCTRYVDFDQSTARPYKSEGRYHLPGEVVVCKTEFFENILKLTLPLFTCLPGHTKIIFPPQPRYLFHRCCSLNSHCSNVGKDDHPETIVSSNIRLRTHLKKRLLECGVANYRVADSCCYAKGTCDLSAKERATALRATCAADGVHHTPEGYRACSTNVVQILKCNTLSAVSSSVSGPAKKFHWRGFTSPTGSKLHHSRCPNWGKSMKLRPHTLANPYNRRGGGNSGKH
jgi:hypothetical protein